ncbi:MAG: hypothetical protein RRA94_03625 [Bacteroidota bacterium]|nr:hypothetical protein [Bacteroidota bacterium]
MEDLYCYSVENIQRQVRDAEADLGRYVLRLYAVDGRPSREKTEVIEEFFYYPSGGTIRDHDLNILFYEPKLDRYHPSNRDKSQ